MSMRKKYSVKTLIFNKIDPPSNSLLKIILSSILLLLVCYDYSLLRCLKDTVVITASSAAVIPFLKVWAILPLAILFTLLYAKMASRFSHERVFYSLVFLFLSFFLVFAFLLYPNRESLRLTQLALILHKFLPSGCSGFIAMIEHWPLTLFYTMAELWSNIILSILTWGFLNHITSLNEARKSYSILGASSNIAAILAGLSANSILSLNKHVAWETNLQYMIILITITGLLATAIFFALNKVVQKKQDNKIARLKKKRIKFSLWDSIQEVARSKHLICLSIIVLAYFFSINTVEVVWKEQLRLLYPSPRDFSHYMNTLTTIIGIFSTLLAMIIPTLIRKTGWTTTALITPITMLITSALFFSVIIFENSLAPMVAFLGTSPLAIAVFLGGMQNCLSKSAKYSVFDTTKEMAFIPLSQEEQIKGKAAIDGIGSRLGKSGASLAHQGLLLIFGTLAGCTPFVGSFMIVVICAWAIATKILGTTIDRELTGTYKGKVTASNHNEEDLINSQPALKTVKLSADG